MSLLCSLALKDFCTQFLECCYNPIMRVVKDNIQHQRAMENDDTYYLWAVRYDGLVITSPDGLTLANLSYKGKKHWGVIN